MSKRNAFISVVLLFLFCISFVLFFFESPVLLFRPVKKQKDCAAIAIRDHVIPFQKFGTRLFTFPNLKEAYHETIYLTEFSHGEKKKEFIDGLNQLLDSNKYVDIFLLAHANGYWKWAGEIDSAKRRNIRLVYNTGCSGAEQAHTWLHLGVKSYVAHKSNESISPVFYFYFLRRWCAGYNLQAAVTESNEFMKTKLGRAGSFSFGKIKADSLILRESIGNCFGKIDYSIHD